MNGNWFSAYGKTSSEETMKNVALAEAKGWFDKLMNIEFRGRGDREKSARFRLSKRTGIPESYLYRLQYKVEEMKDVAGSAYRALMLDYNKFCERNEAAADRYRAERLGLRGHDETTGEEHMASSVRMVAASSSNAPVPHAGE